MISLIIIWFQFSFLIFKFYCTVFSISTQIQDLNWNLKGFLNSILKNTGDYMWNISSHMTANQKHRKQISFGFNPALFLFIWKSFPVLFLVHMFDETLFSCHSPPVGNQPPSKAASHWFVAKNGIRDKKMEWEMLIWKRDNDLDSLMTGLRA